MVGTTPHVTPSNGENYHEFLKINSIVFQINVDLRLWFYISYVLTGY